MGLYNPSRQPVSHHNLGGIRWGLEHVADEIIRFRRSIREVFYGDTFSWRR